MSKSNKKLHSNPEADENDLITKKEICENTYDTPILNKIHVILLNIGNAVCKVINVIISVYGIYFIWTMLHFFASHLYIKLCVPLTFIGFIASPFMTATPHCQGLRWIIFNGATMINNMWIFVGSGVSSVLLSNVYNVPQATSS
jgi:hypothetical protein